MKNFDSAVTYASYLKVNELLSLQSPRSSGPEHDEMLFIVVHQTYELWFKCVLHELARAQQILELGDTHSSLPVLGRVRTIFKVLVSQVDILETMTPLQFNSFRDRLEAASGFQSVQFRELEAVLGRRDKSMVDHLEPNSEPQQRVQSAMNRPALFDSVISYLTKRGHKMPVAVTARDFSEQYEANEEVQESLANTYRNDPEAAMMLERLIDIDEGLQEWRYRHVKMVERTIGMKHGTGGSSGAAYLASTLFKPTFPDLWAVRSRF